MPKHWFIDRSKSDVIENFPKNNFRTNCSNTGILQCCKNLIHSCICFTLKQFLLLRKFFYFLLSQIDKFFYLVPCCGTPYCFYYFILASHFLYYLYRKASGSVAFLSDKHRNKFGTPKF